MSALLPQPSTPCLSHHLPLKSRLQVHSLSLPLAPSLPRSLAPSRSLALSLSLALPRSRSLSLALLKWHMHNADLYCALCANSDGGGDGNGLIDRTGIECSTSKLRFRKPTELRYSGRTLSLETATVRLQSSTKKPRRSRSHSSMQLWQRTKSLAILRQGFRIH